MERDDRAGRAYWESTWAESDLPPPVDVSTSAWTHHADCIVDGWIANHLSTIRPETLLEAGCGASAWLPYLARKYAVAVTGIDYSDSGCSLATACLDRENVEGRVVRADFFCPPHELLGGFDVVISRGVVEHFADTAGVIAALAKFVRPGGVMLTLVPNLAGPLGAIQRRLDVAIYDKHVILDRDQLVEAHKEAGLSVTAADYLVPLNFGTLNLSTPHTPTAAWWAKRIAVAGASRVTRALWAVDRWRTLALGKSTSSLIACAAVA